MKLAFVIPSVGSEPSARLAALLEHASELALHLRGRVELELFAERRIASPLEPGHDARPLAELDPRDFDRILFLVADDPGCAFMLRTLKRVGGIALLLDWGLGRAVRRCWPELDRRGPRGFLRALAVGGLRGARERLVAEPALNRPVVRFADGFIVRSQELRERILVERNVPTPVACIDAAERARVGEQLGEHLQDMFERFPAHLAVRPSLIEAAIQGADRAREQRAEDKERAE